jgi:hypothetical protein
MCVQYPVLLLWNLLRLSVEAEEEWGWGFW